MKPLKPAHREKKRYILIKGKDVSIENIEKAILDYIGILGFAESCLKVIKSYKTSVIIAINRCSLDKVRASLLLSEKDLVVAKVSGSISNLKNW